MKLRVIRIGEKYVTWVEVPEDTRETRDAKMHEAMLRLGKLMDKEKYALHRQK